MLNLINDLFKGLENKHPDWDEIIVKILENEEKAENSVSILEELTSILNQVIEMIKKEDVSKEEVDVLFQEYKCKDYAIRYVNAVLQTYYNFDALRKLEQDDIYKAKKCIDQIWESYILRYNPYFINQDNLLLSDTEYRNVAKEIDRITDFCIERNFHVFAISKQFEDKSGLSSELCDYVSKRMDEDFEKLKLSYVIYNLDNK